MPHDLPLPLLGGRGDGDLPRGDDDLTLLLLDPALSLAGLGGGGSTCLDSSSLLCLSSSAKNPSSMMIGPADEPELPDDDELVPSTVTHRLGGGPGGDDRVLAVLVVLDGVALAGWASRPPPVALVVARRVVATIVALSLRKSETKVCIKFLALKREFENSAVQNASVEQVRSSTARLDPTSTHSFMPRNPLWTKLRSSVFPT